MVENSNGQFFKNRVSISTLFFSSGFLFASWASRIPYIQSSLKINNGTLGLLLLGIPIGALCSIPISNRINQSFPSYQITLFSISVQVVFLGFIGLCPNSLLLGLALFFYGLFSNITNIAMNVQAVNLEEKMQANIMSSFHGFFSVANMAGAFFGGIMGLISIIPFYHFLISSSITVLLVIALGRNLLKTDNKPELPEKIKPSLHRLLPPVLVIYLGLIAFCVMLSEGAMADWSGVYIKTELHIVGGLNAAGYTSFALAMALIRFFGEWIIKQWGTSRTVWVSGLLIASGLSLVLIFPVFLLSLLGFGMVGLGCATVVPIVYSAVGRIKSIPASQGLGTVTIIGYVGFLMGPPAIGFLAQVFSIRIGFGVVLALGILISFLSKLVPEKGDPNAQDLIIAPKLQDY